MKNIIYIAAFKTYFEKQFKILDLGSSLREKLLAEKGVFLVSCNSEKWKANPCRSLLISGNIKDNICTSHNQKEVLKETKVQKLRKSMVIKVAI